MRDRLGVSTSAVIRLALTAALCIIVVATSGNKYLMESMHRSSQFCSPRSNETRDMGKGKKKKKKMSAQKVYEPRAPSKDKAEAKIHRPREEYRSHHNLRRSVGR